MCNKGSTVCMKCIVCSKGMRAKSSQMLFYYDNYNQDIPAVIELKSNYGPVSLRTVLLTVYCTISDYNKQNSVTIL